jgi:hypothetical protein
MGLSCIWVSPCKKRTLSYTITLTSRLPTSTCCEGIENGEVSGTKGRARPIAERELNGLNRSRRYPYNG